MSVLRLVGRDEPAGASRARLRAAEETRLASRLEATDARMVFAVEVERALEGGRAAILRPERRRALIAAAVGRGLREFDANLVIAIVQDGVRGGGGSQESDVRSRLAMVPSGEASWRPEACLACAGALGAALFVALLVLVLGA